MAWDYQGSDPPEAIVAYSASKDGILFWEAHKDCLRFTCSRGFNVRMPLSGLEPAVAEKLQDTAAWGALEELWAEGKLVEIGPGRWELPYDNLYGLEEDSIESLCLPAKNPLQVRVQTKGVPGHVGLGVSLEIRHDTLGNLEGAVARSGPIYFPPSAPPILASAPVYSLLNMASEGPGSDTIEAHFEFLAKVQRAAREAGAVLDGYLETEEYSFPTQLDVEIQEHDPENIELKPSFKRDEVPRDIPSSFLDSDSPPRIHSFKDRRGKHHRVVIGAEVRAKIEKLRRRRSISGSQVPKFIENPQAFLPFDIDLEQFSRRVRGLRTLVYNSRPYLHIHPSEGGWFEGIPGIRLESIRETTSEEPRPNLSDTDRPELSPETYRRLAERARKSGEEYVRHNDGWIRIDPSAADNFLKIIDQYGKGANRIFRIPMRAVLDIYENLEALEFELPPIESLGLPPRSAAFPNPDIPSSFNGKLLPHQTIGYRWLAFLLEKQTGGLLADDMGLGKTIQVIAHMARLAEEKRLKPSLVVCPKTIIENWQRELSMFLPNQRTSVFASGPITAETLSEQELVLMSYDCLRSNQLEVGKVNWQLVVCDEAQYTKNPTAQRTTAVKALKSSHRVALTGTPVENGMIEFWCIMDFVRPGLLGCWSDFRSEHERPLIQAKDESQRKPLVDELLNKIGRHYMRRLKNEILDDLPPLTHRTLESQLSKAQFEMYRRIAFEGRTGGRGAALTAITKLLMVCAHPYAVEGDLSAYRYNQAECPKLDATLHILNEIRESNQKVLIFTRFLRVQRILQSTIRQVFGIWPDVLNGEVVGNRQLIVDLFSNRPGFNVLILSHDVGGVGLNITAANHVIHYTRPWNPAKENQGTDRSHRIGQNLPVTVYYPLVTDNRFETVEARLNRLLEAKRSLARDVLRPTKDSAVSAQDLLTCLDEVPEMQEELK